MYLFSPSHVVEQGDPGVAVGVVLDGSHLGRHTVLGSPEVDHPGTGACDLRPGGGR